MFSVQALVLVSALSSVGDTVLLDFSAEGCGPCREMEPTVRRLSAEGYPVRRVNVQQQPELARRFGVRHVPCFVLLANGQEAGRIVGGASYQRLVSLFTEAGVPHGGNPVRQVRGQSPDSQDPGIRSRSRPRRSGTQPGPVRETAATAESPAREAASFPARSALRSNTPQDRALQASVRLRVEDRAGWSYGTGTIVDTHGDEALVLTCGHLFRDSNGQGKITVELFVPGAQVPVPGQLIAYEADKRDIGLVSIRPGREVTPVRIAPPDYRFDRGAPVFTVGCDNGKDPSLRESQITAVNKYLGPPNIEVAGQPVDGRSGGGLFTASGLLIGICNAADPQDDEGVYAALPTIHAKLDEIGQRQIYQPNLVARDNAGQSVSEEIDDHLANTPGTALADRMPPLADSAGNLSDSADLPGAAAITRGEARPPARQVPYGDAEIICILRSRRDPNGASEVLIFDQPSPALLQQLLAEQRGGGGNFRPQASDRVVMPQARRERPQDAGPIVRGQSDDR